MLSSKNDARLLLASRIVAFMVSLAAACYAVADGHWLLAIALVFGPAWTILLTLPETISRVS